MFRLHLNRGPHTYCYRMHSHAYRLRGEWKEKVAGQGILR